MAKALLFLIAEDNRAAALERHLTRALKDQFGDDEQHTVLLMRAVADDFFHDPASAAYPRPDVVLELASAPGRPLAGSLPGLEAALDDAPLAGQRSLALVMLERQVIPCPPQPVHYHYLMLKADGFSQADYLDYYCNFHARFGLNTPAIAGYSQNIVDLPGSEDLAARLGLGYREVTSISELKMPSLQAFAADPGVLAIAEPAALDEARFVNRAKSVMFNSAVILRLGNFEVIGEAVFPQHFPA